MTNGDAAGARGHVAKAALLTVALLAAAAFVVVQFLPYTPLANGGANHSIIVTSSCESDDCQSTVDLSPVSLITYPDADLTEFAGHNTGPASTIQTYEVGDTVRVWGYGAGVYRITQIVNTTKGATTDDVPSGLAFQTCLDDVNMRLAYATKIVQ